jgi:hypothetical protein
LRGASLASAQVTARIRLVGHAAHGANLRYRLRALQGLQSVFHEFLEESKRQVDAAGDRAVRWYFSEKEAADFVRARFYFNQYIRDRIDIQVRPFPGRRQ